MTLNGLLNLDARSRLGASLAVGTLIYLVLPQSMLFETRLLIVWSVSVMCFLALAYAMVAAATAENTRSSAMRQDQSGAVILAFVVLAASASLFAISNMIGHATALPAMQRELLLLLSGVSVICSWLLTHTMFTFHYAHRYYGDIVAPWGEPDEGLCFPGGASPDYMDFAYFSFVIAMTSQVSDVQVISRQMRRLVMIHGIISFFFYTVILALTISIVANSI